MLVNPQAMYTDIQMDIHVLLARVPLDPIAKNTPLMLRILAIKKAAVPLFSKRSAAKIQVQNAFV